MPFAQKLSNFSAFNIDIMFTDFKAISDLLELTYACTSFVFLELFCTLVIVLAPIDNLGNGRVCFGRYLD